MHVLNPPPHMILSLLSFFYSTTQFFLPSQVILISPPNFFSFSSGEVLLKKVIELFEPPQAIASKMDPAALKGIKVRALNVIVHWLTSSPNDWSEEGVQTLDALLLRVKDTLPTSYIKLVNALCLVLQVHSQPRIQSISPSRYPPGWASSPGWERVFCLFHPLPQPSPSL